MYLMDICKNQGVRCCEASDKLREEEEGLRY